ncbi:MAG: RNA-guided endonuclease TnpB family protein, partial [Candidatus Micrarchaeota archaeon]
IAHRVEKAIWRYVKLKKQGKKAGFPRFKSIDRMKSLYYPQAGFSLDKKLKTNPFGEIQIVRHRQIKGRIKTLTLKRELSGKWFACFSVEEEKQIQKTNKGGRVGIDLGLKNFATLSNRIKIENPRHLKKHENRLAFLQRKLSKKIRGSANRKKSKKKVALLHEKVANTRRGFLHNLSHHLVNIYSFIALEELSSKKMSEENYGKQIRDAGWNMFASMLAYKAEEAGCQMVFVNPKDTTKECSACGSIQNMPLSERTYHCPVCGMHEDRDLNASLNILNRATAGITHRLFGADGAPTPTGVGCAGSNACGDERALLSEKQEAHAFRRG